MTFNRKNLHLSPLASRIHDLDINIIRDTDFVSKNQIPPPLFEVGKQIISAKEKKAATILMIGAHVLRAGMQKYLIDLMEHEYLSCIAMNGAGIIHDYELSLIGATTESVAKYIKSGQFGLWQETGELNNIINESFNRDSSSGLGYAVGKKILKSDLPYSDTSVLAAAVRLNIPVTVHVGIGYDIIHEHPNCNGAATGALSYNDFLTFAAIVDKLEGGVVMNFGSGVMAPEVFLKALSMARNVAVQQKREIKKFTTLVCDLHNLPKSFSCEPAKDDPSYYFRPFKTMLVRTVADGGTSYYVQGDHKDTVPALWSAVNNNSDKN